MSYLSVILRFWDVKYTSSEEVRICCPLCQDTGYHLYFNTRKGVGHCFVCGWGGRIGRLLSLMGHDWTKDTLQPRHTLEQFEDAVQRIRESSGGSSEDTVTLPRGYVPFVPGIVPKDMIGRMCLNYLRKRGLGLGISTDHGFGYGTAGQTLSRLIFPIEGSYWQARTIFSFQNPKYINPKIRKGARMFNAEALNGKKVLVAEGVFSALALGENAIGLLGKEPNKEQLRRLKAANARTFHIHLDAGAEESALKLGEELRLVGKKVIIQEYEEGDPDNGTPGRCYRLDGETRLRSRILSIKLNVESP